MDDSPAELEMGRQCIGTNIHLYQGRISDFQMGEGDAKGYVCTMYITNAKCKVPYNRGPESGILDMKRDAKGKKQNKA